MSAEAFWVITSLVILTINAATMLVTFNCRYGLRVTVVLLVVFTAAVYLGTLFSGNMLIPFGTLRGMVYLPLMLWLMKGQLLQKTFAFFLQFLLTVLQLSIAETIAQIFYRSKSGEGYLLTFILLLVMYFAYVVLMLKYGRNIFDKLFERGKTSEWALYTMGVFFSFAVLMVARNNPGDTLQYVLLLLFILWSFGILCFTIVNIHEKARHKYDADFARDIISSGSEHYQKMNEMYDALRIMRHDYKYHLDTISELLSSGNKIETEKYLADIKRNLSKKELPNFCSNSIINALLTSFSERCANADIKCDIQISMPETIPIPNYEMCIILGNLLENAFEASARQDVAGKIELAINTQGAHLAIMVKNTFDGGLIQNKGRIVSRKADGGLGLRSVEAVALRHGGELMTEWDDTTFSAYVLMRL